MSFSVHNVGCVSGGEAFLLLVDGGKTALIDSGFLFTAKGTVKKISDILGDRPLDYILLTHSHYDHVSGSVAVKKRWPDAKVVSAEHAADVFNKPNAVKTMMKLNRAAAIAFRKSPFFMGNLKGLHTDIRVKEGDIIDLGTMKFKVLESPGHTWDTIAFWCEEERFLIANETLGVFASAEDIAPACLVSCKRTLDFIHRVKELDPDKILMPHYDVVYGDDCRKTTFMAERDTEKMRDIILENYDNGKTEEEIKQIVKDIIWVGPMRKGQPEAAFDLNNKYVVPTIIKEYRSSE